MKSRGSITIYLSIILVSVILVVSVVLESGRVNAIQTKSRSIAYMAAESVLAGYAKQVYEDYGVLLVWEDETVEEQLKKYIQDNISMADLKGESIDFIKSDLMNVNVNGPEYFVEDGKGFIQQIISYMKYAGTIQAVTKLVQKFDEYSEKNKVETQESSDVTVIVDKDCDELIAMVEEIDKIVADIKDIRNLETKVDTVSQELEIIKADISMTVNEKKADKNFLELYRELITELDRKARDVDSAIKLIKQYELKKELFIKENGYTAGDGDYIEENLKILENVKDKIEKNKELAISKNSKIDSKNIKAVTESMENMGTVISILQSLQVNEVTKEDKKNQSIYESAVAFLKKGVLSLVVDDVTNVSDSAISLSNLPTTLKKKNRKNISVLEQTKNKASLSLYAGMKFGNYLSSEKETALKYEMEYIIGGQGSDVDNLMKTVEKIAAVRNAMNLASIVTDKEKMSQISTVSSSAATSIGLPFLEPVIKAALTEAWALAESVSDVKELLKGEEIPLIKNRKSWNTSLDNLINNHSKSYEGKAGLDYETYLMMLIMLEDNETCVYRVMDLIQVNVQKRYNKDFKMARCFGRLEFTATFEIEPLFTTMPWVVRNLSENNSDYEYEIKCSYSY